MTSPDDPNGGCIPCKRAGARCGPRTYPGRPISGIEGSGRTDPIQPLAWMDDAVSPKAEAVAAATALREMMQDRHHELVISPPILNFPSETSPGPLELSGEREPDG